MLFLNRTNVLLAGIAILLCFSCSGLRVTEAEFAQLYSVGKDGRSSITSIVMPGGTKSIKDPDFTTQLMYTKKSLSDYRESGGKRILLYFHGGMNGVSSGAKNARKLLGRIEADTNKDEEIFAIAVNWNSGYLDSYGDGMFCTIRGVRSLRYAPLASPFRILAGAGRAVFRMPYTLGWQGVNNLRQAGGVKVQPPQESLQTFPSSEGFDQRMDENHPGFGFGRNIVQPFFPGLFRVVSTPFLDATGPAAYENMRRTVNQAFVRDDSEIASGFDVSEPTPDFSIGLMDKLAVELHEVVGAYNENKAWAGKIKITVAAHSMGAHVANELLFRHPELPVDEIIFLAPACSTREFAYSTIPYIQSRLAEGVVCNFYCLMLHPEREKKERSGGGFAPEGSLLVWIDDYLTAHYSDLDATMGQWNNAMTAIPQLRLLESVSWQQLSERLHFRMLDWKKDDQNARFGNAKVHGDVDNLRFWRDEVKWPPSDSGTPL